jgi:hypothetical protein
MTPKKMEQAISTTFGTPKHGWLPVHITSGNYKLNLDASDVPVNPLEILCDVLLLVNTQKGEVWWNLEPAAVFFEFEKVEEIYKLTIMSAESYEGLRKGEIILEGAFQDIIEPFVNALVLFYSKPNDEKHWPSLEIGKINRLQRLTAGK